MISEELPVILKALPNFSQLILRYQSSLVISNLGKLFYIPGFALGESQNYYQKATL